ncbi:MAG: RNA 3'-phosphate cyclase [Candidatus Nealsonbacteria bacterium CG02_land_8_20_14_3_00_34_20]|uniref:RNA 3'-terminal phosphate cyclase n=2 Tax=Candidatus Nealsoniibacteriota TaxID=1817911 RepID=A0A2M7DAM6_9BACT|nr:MAG: RNA 3'-phosphate cyclase [Candidatus Nealsonbacteria bacterium CG11_big_fil_rev_8_21_14_0_20_35_11]PIV45519.1 MAG: RNA 3'-phosphate cyclase [Candidatus Nealsonbacteria bacterium CG02_land_8_20_14_3_00_34_20]
MIKLDGAVLEGGGQLLRTAVALATITKNPCHIFNIRQGREKPGLMPQHLLGIQALSRLCNGRLEGDYLGSKEIKFFPGEITKEKISLSIGTAASLTLILQSLIPPALFALKPVEIHLDGGATDTFFSPTLDHFRYVFLKILEKMGGKIDINILRRGYYPEGGAEVEIKIYPSKLKPINLTERGSLEKIFAISGASEFLKDKKVAERQLSGAREVLGKLKLPTEEKIEYYDTRCPGSQICLIAEFQNSIIGSDNLGRLGKPAEEVGKEAALELLKEQKSDACLDKHLADQIPPYIALTPKSQITVSEITSHCKTNIWVIEKLLEGKFEAENRLIQWTSEN